MYRAAIDSGADERNILATMHAYSGKDEAASNLVQAIWDALPTLAAGNAQYYNMEGRLVTISTDEQDMYRMFAFAPATEEEKRWLGFSDEQIDDMSSAEKIEKVIIPLVRRRNELAGR